MRISALLFWVALSSSLPGCAGEQAADAGVQIDAEESDDIIDATSGPDALADAETLFDAGSETGCRTTEECPGEACFIPIQEAPMRDCSMVAHGRCAPRSEFDFCICLFGHVDGLPDPPRDEARIVCF